MPVSMRPGYSSRRHLTAGPDGFVACYLIRTANGGASVSVVENDAGTTQSTKVAAAFIGEHHPGVAAGSPDVIEGPVVIDFRETTHRSPATRIRG